MATAVNGVPYKDINKNVFLNELFKISESRWGLFPSEKEWFTLERYNIVTHFSMTEVITWSKQATKTWESICQEVNNISYLS